MVVFLPLQDATIQLYLSSGAPRNKLVLGVALYGRTFLLGDAASTGIGAPAHSTAFAGPYTREDGMLGYNEVRVMALDLYLFFTVEETDQGLGRGMNNHAAPANITGIRQKIDYQMSFHRCPVACGFWCLLFPIVSVNPKMTSKFTYALEYKIHYYGITESVHDSVRSCLMIDTCSGHKEKNNVYFFFIVSC